ncbi:MAG: hypothetical protein OHK0021_11270 [Bryobacter sp.]
MGVAMRADPAFGERPGSLQAPFVMRRGGEFWMFYSSGGRFFVAHSYDGKTFARYPRPGGGFGLFANYQEANPEQGFAGAGGRDIMMLRHENRWLAYYTASADPFHFGVDDDRYLVARLPIAAPEILTHEGATYVVSLLPDLTGMRIARIHLP